MTDTIISGLNKRRADLLTEIKQTDAMIRSLLTDLGHLDATIRQFDTAYEAPPVRVVAGLAGRGQMTRTILAILRTAREPLSTRDLALRVMMARGQDCTDRRLVGQVVGRVRRAAGRQRKNGVLTAERGEGQAQFWRIVG